MADHELWAFNNALFFVTLIIIFMMVLIYGISKIADINKIRKNWADERCSPMIMPFASIFGYNTKENFDFCLGKVFNTHSMPMLGSMGTMFSHFTGLLTIILDSISSLRNTIASLGGGINVVFQEFTERISTFFFKLRVSAIHIKTLIGRMYAILFSVMYMGLSGITGMTTFTNTFLFSFLNTFCFPKETEIEVLNKGRVPIKDIQIGDVLLPTNSRVTATFRFYSRGQPMVKLGPVTVSTNHYVEHEGKYIKAGDHPNAIDAGVWDSDEPLYCLNTSDNKIPVEYLTFLDYDEDSAADEPTMNYIQNRINAVKCERNYKFREYCSAIDENAMLRLETGLSRAKDIKIGDKLATGGEVVGLIRREVSEICELENGTITTPSTLIWMDDKWVRCGEYMKHTEKHLELVSFIVVPNSQIELEDGTRLRDYMELCSPDSEMYYSQQIEA